MSPRTRVTALVAFATLAATTAQARVDRTPGFAPKPAPVAIPDRPVVVPFMPGIRLGVSRAEVLRQEGPGLAKRQFPRDRYREPGKALAPGHTAQPDPRLVASPALEYRGRRVFGLDTFELVYTANPHTGRYDMLGAGMLAPDPARPQRWKRFHAVRAALIERFGPPEWEALRLSAGQIGRRLSPADLESPPPYERPPAFAVARWRLPGVSFQISTRFSRPTRDAVYVLGLTVWTPTAEPHRASDIPQDWSNTTDLPLPGPKATTLYTPK